MNADELEQQLDELELRLERLRSLYEQYFLGIEKIEPAVARKDVDRRIWLLRREKIRNTARRFKLQTIIQRYNTFQQYWQRICREIENGTYRRHLLKAAQTIPGNLLTIVAKKRFGRASLERDAAALAHASEPPAPPARGASGQIPAAQAADPVPAFSGSNKKPQKSSPVASRKPSYSSLNAVSSRPSQRPHPSLHPTSQVPEHASAPNVRSALRLAPPAKPGRIPQFNAESPLGPPPKPGAKAHVGTPLRSDDPARSSGLTPDRLQYLHQRLVSAKGQTSGTRAPSLSSLERSLKAAEAKLRSEHNNRRVDFDVVIKNGRAIIKPTVR